MWNKKEKGERGREGGKRKEEKRDRKLKNKNKTKIELIGDCQQGAANSRRNW